MRQINFTPQKYILALYWAAVFSTFFLSYIRIGHFPMANYISVLIAVLILITATYGNLSYLLRNQLLRFSVVIVVLIALTLFFFGNSFIDIVYRVLKSMIVGMVLSTAAYIVVCTYGVKSAIKPILFCAFITSLIAILQSGNIDLFWQMREFAGYGGDGTVKAQIESRSRIPGMAFYSITLSYQLLAALSLGVFYLVYSKDGYLKRSHYNKKNRTFWSVLLISVGLLLSGARSTYPALLMLFFIVGHHKAGKILIFIPIILVAFYNQEIFDRIMNVGLGGRYLSNITAISVLFDHPFGLGGESYVQTVLNSGMEHYSLVYPHNHFLTSAVSFGLIPILIFLIYNAVLITRVSQLQTYSKYALLSMIFVYHLNTLFHNAGMMLGEQTGWYMFGIIEGVLTIYAKNKKSFVLRS